MSLRQNSVILKKFSLSNDDNNPYLPPIMMTNKRENQVNAKSKVVILVIQVDNDVMYHKLNVSFDLALQC